MSSADFNFELPNTGSSNKESSSPSGGDFGPRVEVPATRDTLFVFLERPISDAHLIFAGVGLIVWLVLLLFPKYLLSNSLDSQFADHRKSKSAGTALYVFLATLGAALAVGLIYSAWDAWEFYLISGVVVFITFLIFIISFAGARKSRVGVR